MAPSGLLAAASLRDSAGIDAAAVLVAVDSSAGLIAELVALARDFAAIHLMRTEPARTKEAQLALRGAAPVITDRQTTAIAMTAALLSTLARAGLSPHAAQAVIIGAAQNPTWPLAVAAWLGEIISWNPDDSYYFPLPKPARRATIVLDVLGSPT
ncbi:hypothetical protein ACVGVM_28000 (plasmid) [Pseudonocardia bannensis]|uniref:Uncharacterized protein n=1 Tax=Pseudonocardia bannensis TaxID=630973 RepID=A0A848DI76_9PSEU|nr:hypothetical protein [Pseudonocardia bannensis]NMH92382.1 hypothetical protein [Pseudonocardia bannensis]